MINIFDAPQNKLIDSAIQLAEGLTTLDLMERASARCVLKIKEHVKDKSLKMLVIAGNGNNGGDALAIARMLFLSAFENIEILCVQQASNSSSAYTTNLEKIKLIKNLPINVVPLNETEFSFEQYELIVDGITGSGFYNQAQGQLLKIITAINNAKAKVISIDLPSGMACIPQEKNGLCVLADLVLTFNSPKLSFLLPETGQAIKKWETIDLGLQALNIELPASAYMLTEELDLNHIFKHRQRFDHKGIWGHGLLIAGSNAAPGAAMLSAAGSLKAGIGLLTIHTIGTVGNAMLGAWPETMQSIDNNDRCWTQDLDIDKYTALGIGPGIGTYEATKKVLIQTIENAKTQNKPLVLDADALNIIAQCGYTTKLPQNVVLTPHIKEFDRMFGEHQNFIDRIRKAQALSLQYGWTIVLKNAFTAVICKGNCYFNPNGNAGMAKGGSGDVLTGITLAFLANGYKAHEAAKLAVYLHGLAGDLAAAKNGFTAMLPSQLIAHLPMAIKTIEKPSV